METFEAKITTVISEHWTDGGTGITNFGQDRLLTFIKAINIFGDDSIFISCLPMKGFTHDCFSLHRNDEFMNLNEFWEVVRSLDEK